MSNSYKNFSTNLKTRSEGLSHLEKLDLRKKRKEHLEALQRREKLEREEWERMKNLRDYLRDKGEE